MVTARGFAFIETRKKKVFDIPDDKLLSSRELVHGLPHGKNA